jgi:hypothetical protein
MRGAWLIVVCAMAVPAQGDELDDQILEFDVMPGKVGPSMSQMIADRLTELGAQMDGHLGALSLDRVAFRVDGRARKAHLRLGKGDGETFLRFDSDMHFRSGLARVQAKVELSVKGRKLLLELPEFQVVPRSYDGDRYLEVRIPIIQGTFEPEKWLGKLVGAGK